MSAHEQDPVRTLAERIASRLATKDEAAENSASPARRGFVANVGDELAALRASVSEIGQRLTQIESHVVNRNDAPRAATSHGDARQQPPQRPSQSSSPQPGHASSQPDANPAHWLSGTYVPAVHPSEERFGIDEAVSELVEFFEREKVCNVEPGGKPCDHCGMCSSRGF
ncbi:MAG TPA: hypothetical protein VD835_16095 [Pyrinomonadaceae bacterium]|nr:hypothetical protein [Pyrinomonadaceae bacterium]